MLLNLVPDEPQLLGDREDIVEVLAEGVRVGPERLAH